MKCEKTVLKNGIRLLLVPVSGTRTVTVLVLFGTGSKYETRRVNGISHFLEHLFFKGTKKRPTTKILSEELDSVGAMYNAFTGKEVTGYWVKVDATHLRLALDVVSDMLLNPLFIKEEIEREKGVVIEEINMYRDTPMEFVGDLFEELIYGDQPAGWAIAGTPDIVRNLTRDDILSYRGKQYVGSNAVICIAGNITRAQVRPLVSKYFGPLPSGKPEGKSPVSEHQSDPRIKLFTKQTDQTHFVLGVRAFHREHKDRFALSLLTTILGGNMSSRLFISIRERQGLAYYICASSELYTDSGYLSVHAGVKNDSAEQAVRSIIKECKSLREKAVGAKELSKAKEYIKGKTQIHLESSDAVASFWGEQEVVDRKTETVEEIMKAYSKVTVRDIKRVANIIFRNDRLNLAIIGPISKSGGLQKILT